MSCSSLSFYTIYFILNNIFVMGYNLLSSQTLLQLLFGDCVIFHPLAFNLFVFSCFKNASYDSIQVNIVFVFLSILIISAFLLVGLVASSCIK